MKRNPKTFDNLISEQLVTFYSLFEPLASVPILHLPQPHQLYSIDRDVSHYVISSFRFQINAENIRCPIRYFSRKPQAVEPIFSRTKKDRFAEVWAFRTFRTHFGGKQFTIFTDHNSSLWLFNVPERSGPFKRCGLRLWDFNFNIQYKKRIMNFQSDALLRFRTSADVVTANAELEFSTFNTHDGDNLNPVYLKFEEDHKSLLQWMQRLAVLTRTPDNQLRKE